MAKESELSAEGRDLAALQSALSPQGGRRAPPVHLWDPPFCGDLDMRIARDGTWFYNGTPIGRHALVSLFASVLRREGDRYFLVTPVEKVGITVEDAPFLGVEMRVSHGDHVQEIEIRTNVDDWVRIDADHPLHVEEGEAGGLKPYVMVRAGLQALIKRSVFYDLVDLGGTRVIEGVEMFGVESGGVFFLMAPAEAIGWEP